MAKLYDSLITSPIAIKSLVVVWNVLLLLPMHFTQFITKTDYVLSEIQQTRQNKPINLSLYLPLFLVVKKSLLYKSLKSDCLICNQNTKSNFKCDQIQHNNPATHLEELFCVSFEHHWTSFLFFWNRSAAMLINKLWNIISS